MVGEVYQDVYCQRVASIILQDVSLDPKTLNPKP